MAEMAYLAQVPRDLRQHIGQWAQEATADVYTRNHSQIIMDIWERVLAKPPESHTELRPADPADKRYTQTEAPGPADEEEEEHAPTTPADVVHTNEYPENLGGPLTVALNHKPSGADRFKKAHFFRPNGRAVAHGNMEYNPKTADVITGPDDWKDALSKGDVRICILCSRGAHLPTSWTTSHPPLQEPEDLDTFTDTDESDQNTDSEADTESEDEALAME
jgi:hypothetical protein